MSKVREAFNPVPMAANASYDITGSTVAGFLAKTAGTISIAGRNSAGTGAVTFVDAVPVAAGAYTPLPIMLPSPGAVVTLGGGASGTLLV